MSYLATSGKQIFSILNSQFSILALRAAAFLILLLLLFDVSIPAPFNAKPRVRLILDDSPSMRLTDGSGGARGDAAGRKLTAALQAQGLEVEREFFNAEKAVSFEATPQVNHRAQATVAVSDAFPSPDLIKLLAALPVQQSYAALISPNEMAADVSINQVSAAENLTVGVPAVFAIALRAQNAANREALVTISDVGGVLASQRVKFNAADETQTIALSVTPPLAGLTNFTVKVAPLTDEINQANNEYRLQSLIAEKPKRILVFESQPSWDAKFLRRAFDNNPAARVDYFAQVSKTATAQSIETADDQKAIAELRQVLGRQEKLFEYDAIVLGAVEANFLSSAESRNLIDFVERRGGGLLILGVNNFVGSALAPSSPLAALLPVRVDNQKLGAERKDSNLTITEAVSTNRVATLTITNDGQQSSVFGFLRDADEIQKMLSATRLNNSFVPLREVLPAASVLAEWRINEKATQPAIAAGQFGAGRIVVLTGAEFYRYGFADEAGKSFIAQLWQGLIYYAAAQAHPPVFAQVSNGDAETNQIELLLRDKNYNPQSIETITSSAKSLDQQGRETGRVVDVYFAPDSGQIGRLTATVGLVDAAPLLLEIKGKAAGQEFDAQLLLSAKDANYAWRALPEAKTKWQSLFPSEKIFELDRADEMAKRIAAEVKSQTPPPHRLRLLEQFWLWLLAPLLLALTFFLERRRL